MGKIGVKMRNSSFWSLLLEYGYPILTERISITYLKDGIGRDKVLPAFNIPNRREKTPIANLPSAIDGDRRNIVIKSHTINRARYGLAVINLAEFRIPWVIPLVQSLESFHLIVQWRASKAHLHVHFFKI